MPKPAPQGRSLLGLLVQIAAPVVAVAGVLFGVIWLGWLTKKQLDDNNRLNDNNRIEFASIECASPPNTTHEEFLGEVQYFSSLPDRLETSDDLVKKLLSAFTRHPSVEEVQKITLLPEQRVRVQLRFRTPVLAVEQDGMKRAVDRYGIRLPDKTPTGGLPLLRPGKPPLKPHGAAGTVWGDERVTATARTAAFLRDGQDKLALTEIAVNADELVLTTATGAKILWGHAPGDEAAKEATAERKREQLMAMEVMTGQIDVR